MVVNNTFQGNLAGAGDGGGIALVGVNGTERHDRRQLPHRVDIVNNVIANNGAGVAGGGISLLDAGNVRIINNTIALNDSEATGSRAFDANVTPGRRRSRGAGVAARTHSPALGSIVGALSVNGLPQQSFSNPVVQNSIVLDNRSFNWRITPGTDVNSCLLNTPAQNCYGLVPNIAAVQTPVFSDLAVLDDSSQMTASNSMLSALVQPGAPFPPLRAAWIPRGPTTRSLIRCSAAPITTAVATR